MRRFAAAYVHTRSRLLERDKNPNVNTPHSLSLLTGLSADPGLSLERRGSAASGRPALRPRTDAFDHFHLAEGHVPPGRRSQPVAIDAGGYTPPIDDRKAFSSTESFHPFPCAQPVCFRSGPAPRLAVRRRFPAFGASSTPPLLSPLSIRYRSGPSKTFSRFLTLSDKWRRTATTAWRGVARAQCVIRPS